MNEVKSTPVYFLASGSTTNSNGIMLYSTPSLNIGSALTASNGIFLAPTAGKYYFSYTGDARAMTPDRGQATITLMNNDNGIVSTNCACYSAYSRTGTDCSSLIVDGTFDLKKGDKISIKVTTSAADIFGNKFTGWLISEDISSLLA